MPESVSGLALSDATLQRINDSLVKAVGVSARFDSQIQGMVLFAARSQLLEVDAVAGADE
eukprot:1181164-Rhodomonas_salina.1